MNVTPTDLYLDRWRHKATIGKQPVVATDEICTMTEVKVRVIAHIGHTSEVFSFATMKFAAFHSNSKLRLSPGYLRNAV